MEFLQQALDLFLHVDKHLVALVNEYGTLTYAILFLVIFIETGFVVMPFLPGDSLLFATGAIAAVGSFDLYALMGLLALAAVLGDTVNYWIGRSLGRKAYTVDWVNHQHLDRAQAFYENYGGKTIILARFVPIIRTFAPFVAGIGRMSYVHFIAYNIVGGIAWVAICTLAGYYFGAMDIVKKNFELVILAIVVISCLPVVFEVIKARRQSRE